MVQTIFSPFRFTEPWVQKLMYCAQITDRIQVSMFQYIRCITRHYPFEEIVQYC